jgi:hypothetical protein
MVVARRATEAVFWLLLLAAQLPAAGALWLAAAVLRMSDPYPAYVRDLVRWRRSGGPA